MESSTEIERSFGEDHGNSDGAVTFPLSSLNVTE